MSRAPGGIFINYRRGDEPGFTQALLGRLEQAFPADRLFIDVDNIPPGEDFVHVLDSQVAHCDILLAVIGNGWLDATDERGNRRLDDPNDFVRIEIESALRQGKRVIPVLVHQARMPRPDELPEAIRPLATRNAVRLTHERFRADVQGLVKALQQAPGDIEAPSRAPAAHVQADEAGKRTRAQRLEPRGERRSSRPAVVVGSGIVLAGAFIGALAFWAIGRPPAPSTEPSRTLIQTSPPAAQLLAQSKQPSPSIAEPMPQPSPPIAQPAAQPVQPSPAVAQPSIQTAQPSPPVAQPSVQAAEPSPPVAQASAAPTQPAMQIAQPSLHSPVPRSFQWFYNYSPKGWRYWSRNEAMSWMEKYPDGTQNNFAVLKNYRVYECNGVLLQKVRGDTNDATTQVFIPEKDCKSQNLFFRFMGPTGPTSDWNLAGKMERIQY